jgi:hypothetical protein
MIEMKCPSCGAGGRIPKEKVNARLVCKKCLRVFHVTVAGNTVLGEPAAAKEEPKSRSTRESTRESSRHDQGQAFDELTSRLTKVKLPQVQPMTLGLVAGVVLLSSVGYWLVFYKQSLATRSETVARCIIKSDMKTVVELAVPGTEMDTMRWYHDVYKSYMDLKLALAGQEAGISIQLPGAESGGTTPVNLRFSKDGLRFDGSIFNDALQPNPSLSQSKQSLDVPLFWAKDLFGNWQLDGTKTFAGTATATH